MEPVYIVTTLKGQYVCEVFEHPSAGFVWQVGDRRINYAIPCNMPTSKERLTFQVRRSFGDATLQVKEG